MAVVGKREAESGAVALRTRGAGKKQEIVQVDVLISRLRMEVKRRTLTAGAAGERANPAAATADGGE
jgi:threonyl-tRNA synthetase